MEKLSSFSHKEVQMILCGNQSPSWTSEDVVNYTEPKLGYTRDRYGIGARALDEVPLTAVFIYAKE